MVSLCSKLASTCFVELRVVLYLLLSSGITGMSYYTHTQILFLIETFIVVL